MAYVEAHAALRDHPKTKKAARMLKIAPREVIGHLLYLWWWCQDYAQDGNLSTCSETEIAEAADWSQDPHEFVDALITCGRPGEPGFLEIEADGALMVHDWFDYGGKLFKIRAQGAKRQANWRARHAGDASITPGNATETGSDALVTRHVTQSNAYRGDKIRGEDTRGEETRSYAAVIRTAYEADHLMLTKPHEDAHIETIQRVGLAAWQAGWQEARTANKQNVVNYVARCAESAMLASAASGNGHAHTQEVTRFYVRQGDVDIFYRVENGQNIEEKRVPAGTA